MKTLARGKERELKSKLMMTLLMLTYWNLIENTASVSHKAGAVCSSMACKSVTTCLTFKTSPKRLKPLKILEKLSKAKILMTRGW